MMNMFVKLAKKKKKFSERIVKIISLVNNLNSSGYNLYYYC